MTASVSSSREEIYHTQHDPPLFSKSDLNLHEDERFANCRLFSMTEFKIQGLLGFGTFGVVKASLHISTQTNYAIKFISKDTILQTTDGIDILLSEIELLSSFQDCTFLSSCVGFCQTEDEVGIVMPLYAGGELFSLLDDTKKLPDSCRLYIAAEILCGLEEMHSRKVMYRDLKAENVMIGNDLHVKLTDFGFSKRLAPGRGGAPGRTLTLVGTPDYTAPEIIQREWYSFPADIWSLGIIFYELFCRIPPFDLVLVDPDNVSGKYQRILNGHLTFPCGCSPEFTNLMSQMLHRNPDKRPSLQQIKAHPFFKAINWEKVKNLKTPKEYLPVLHIDNDMPCKNFDPFDEWPEDDENDAFAFF